MALYYFLIYDGSSRAVDEEGSYFLNPSAAKSEALESLRDIVSEAVKTKQPIGGLAIEVCDAGGNVIETIRARETLL